MSRSMVRFPLAKLDGHRGRWNRTKSLRGTVDALGPNSAKYALVFELGDQPDAPVLAIAIRQETSARGFTSAQPTEPGRRSGAWHKMQISCGLEASPADTFLECQFRFDHPRVLQENDLLYVAGVRSRFTAALRGK